MQYYRDQRPADRQTICLGAATHHGRILVLNRDCAKESTGHGSPFRCWCMEVRAEPAAEKRWAGYRGVRHYMQRVAVQGSPNSITAITHVYQPHAQQTRTKSIPLENILKNCR